MSAATPSASLAIDVVSDVVCPWCFIGKRRLEKAIALRSEIAVSLRWRPFFLNPWVPRDGIARDDYLRTKFGSVERYRQMSQRMVAAGRQEGIAFAFERMTWQPNTLDCHRLLRWAAAEGDASRLKERLMSLYFIEAADLSDPEVLVAAAVECGLEGESVRQRLASDADAAEVQAEARSATEAGIDGVPCSIFGGVLAVSGAQSPEYLADAMDQALARQLEPSPAAAAAG